MVALLPSRRDGTTHIMHGILLQDWITLRGSTADAVTQGEDGYLDMTPYQDVVTWLDVREVTPPAAGSLFNVHLHQRPLKDYRSSVETPTERARRGALHRALVGNGVVMSPTLFGCISTPMGEGEINTFVEAFRQSLRESAG